MRALTATLLLSLGWPAVAEEAPAPASQQTAAEKTFVGLAGRWEGVGETRGMPAALTLHWEPVLDGRFTQLALDNRMTTADGGSWHFQARSYYRVQADGAIAGHWFDSRGMSFPITGSVDAGGAMTILWGTPDTELGRSSYRVVGDQLEVIDEVLTRDGTWRVFGRHRLTRSR
jgi:hypothetical protein